MIANGYASVRKKVITSSSTLAKSNSRVPEYVQTLVSPAIHLVKQYRTGTQRGKASKLVEGSRPSFLLGGAAEGISPWPDSPTWVFAREMEAIDCDATVAHYEEHILKCKDI